jgi:hypothetical protein
MDNKKAHRLRGGQRTETTTAGGGSQTSSEYRTTTTPPTQFGEPTPTIPIKRGKGIRAEVSEGVFTSWVIGSKHYFRKLDGWAFMVHTLRHVQALGVSTAVVIDEESNEAYTAPLAAITELGLEFDAGFGAQICLRRKYWTRTAADAGAQLALWGTL